MTFFETWNNMTLQDAAASVLPCCGSHAWAQGLAAKRPLQQEEALLQASDDVWWSLANADWDEAFRSHPRIGQTRSVGAATAQSLHWSAGEQSGAADLDEDEVKQALAVGNATYEQTFGRIFLVCATGKTAREMLAILQHRLQNDSATELQEAAEQQRQITHLRLKKWLQGEA